MIESSGMIRTFGRADHYAAAAQALADIVVAFADQVDVTPLATNAPKLWPAVPRQLDGNGVVGQACVTVALGTSLTAWRRLTGPRCGSAGPSVTGFLFSRAGAAFSIRVRSSTSSDGGASASCVHAARPQETLGFQKRREKSSPLGLPVVDGASLSSQVGLADHLVEPAEAHARPSWRALLRRRRRSS
jgi:hypothetical protein